ncbi:MAG: type IV secretion system protein [Gammaproteobacteria bacterium]|jgi:type IV secretory pathway TrbL component
MLDPSAISLVQTTFISHINHAFGSVTHYAVNLLFIFATFEVVIFGLLYAFGQNSSWDELFFKVIKIGLIFFLIQNYAWLLSEIINSFAQIGGLVADTHNLSKYIFNPALIWQVGYNVGLGLLQIATTSNTFGLVILLSTLGFGILLVFGLLGIQIVVQLAGFYLVSLISLIMLPLGIFKPSADMFDRSVQAVLKAGVRVAVLIMVIGSVIATWNSFNLTDPNISYNINKILGLFFTSLLFLYLAIKLPAYAANAIGSFKINSSNRNVSMNKIDMPAFQNNLTTSSSFEPASMQAATTIEPAARLNNGINHNASNTSGSTVIQTQAASGITSSGSGLQSGQNSAGLHSASAIGKRSTITKSISDETLKKITASFTKAMQQGKK